MICSKAALICVKNVGAIDPPKRSTHANTLLLLLTSPKSIVGADFMGGRHEPADKTSLISRPIVKWRQTFWKEKVVIRDKFTLFFWQSFLQKVCNKLKGKNRTLHTSVLPSRFFTNYSCQLICWFISFAAFNIFLLHFH